MEIKNLFVKPIDRDIKGVIKVGQDDELNISQELEEYVVTKELQKHFSDFFASYKKGITGNTDKMGVWISGFFGSGKSHFLKILSYLLGNKEVNGKTAFQYFKEDNKIIDQMVLADMGLATSVPTDVVLFNIDSKSEVGGKSSKDAIVSVLQNVFNEMQGFSGSNPWLADLERKLFYEGKIDLFHAKFLDINGEEWIKARSDFDFIQDDVVTTLSEIGFMSEEAGRNWCEKTTSEYPYKVETFANLVKEYLNKKEDNHHIVFLIDEIGQYIGEDSKLMLNLQTVTEDLGTKCGGKAWIIVTSQQDIDSITKTKGNDFSKIQGRFDTRLSLSSANVDEVIKKRILEKKEAGKQSLQLLHENKMTMIKNLILFDDGIEKKLYSNSYDFAEVYPFIPYQFNLLGSVLTSIRTHGASGKHLAEGERSMLALFKESAVRIMNEEIGEIVSFNMFYDALEQFLDHSHKGVISHALENEQLNPEHEEDCFTVNVLKTLFMIKYVKEIKANSNNITSLMVSRIDEDRLALKEKVEASLKELIQQTLVQKNGEIFVFLTNEEQEINRAIEAQSVETTEILNKVSELIFDGLYSEKKYRYVSDKKALNGRYAFPFNQILDGRPYKANQNNELSLKVLTPYSEESTEDASLKILSSQGNTVFVVLPNDKSYLVEIRLAIQIEKFLRSEVTSVITKFKSIKDAKQIEMSERQTSAKLFLEENLRKSSIYVCGEKLQTGAKDINTRITEAMERAVNTVFHKLFYIDSAMAESDIRALLRSNLGQIVIDGIKSNNELALSEVKNYISGNSMKHTKTSMKTLMDRFLKAPYGFVEADMQWIVAKLFKDGEISLFVNNEVISLVSKTEDEILRYLTRKEFLERLMTEIKEKATDKQKKSVKEVARELFRLTFSNEEDDAMMKDFCSSSKRLKDQLEELEKYNYTGISKYPGKEVVIKGKKLLINLLQINRSKDFFENLDRNKEEYFDFAEDYEQVRKFFDGEQKKIFDDAIHRRGIYEDSKTFIVNQEMEAIVSEIDIILTHKKPYSQISKLPMLLDKFTDLYGYLLDELQKPVDDAIEESKKRVFEELEGKLCKEKLENKFRRLFTELSEKEEKCNNVAILQNIKLEADALKIRLLNEIAAEEQVSILQVEGREEYKPVTQVKKRKNISIKAMSSTSSWQIETQGDVKKYVGELEKKLLEILEEGTILNIEF